MASYGKTTNDIYQQAIQTPHLQIMGLCYELISNPPNGFRIGWTVSEYLISTQIGMDENSSNTGGMLYLSEIV